MANVAAGVGPERLEAPDSGTGASSAIGYGRHTVALSIAAVLLIWVLNLAYRGSFAELPNGISFGTDFAISLGAADTARLGGNPYDHLLLLRTERAFLATNGLPTADIPNDGPYNRTVIRVGNPPLYFWALEPLTRFPFRRTALLWIAFETLLAALGFVGMLHFLGWRRRVVPTVLFLAMPQPLMAIYYGNANVLVFAAMGCALGIARSRPFVAGMLLGLAWLKPAQALPFVLLLLLLHLPMRVRAAAGFLTATAALLAVTAIASGPHSIAEWVASLMSYPAGMMGEYELATLAPFLAHWLSPQALPPVDAALFAGACAVTGVFWWRRRAGPSVAVPAGGYLWTLWFLVTPFAHSHDEILLTLPVLALLGPDARNLVPRLKLLFEPRRRTGYSRIPFCALYLTFGTIFIPLALPVPLLFLPVLGVGICLLLASRDGGTYAEYRPAGSFMPAG